MVQAIKHFRTPILTHGIVTIYPYSSSEEYELSCQPLHATQIRLSGNEWTNKDNVILGDSERWSVKVGDGVVLVKPLRTTDTVVSAGPQPEIHPPAPNMRTNLIIHTDKHDYTFNLTVKKPLTEAVSFYYPDDVRAASAARAAALKEN